MLNLDQYQVFLEVARARSFSRAAAALFVTQPAVSQAVKGLEERLGCKLFLRSARGVSLTEEGEHLYREVSGAILRLEEAESHFAGLQTLSAGTLRIGASDTVCKYLLLPFLKEFHRQYPDVSIKVTNRTSSETVRLLREGQVDLGFVNTPTPIDATMDCEEVCKVQDGFVCTAELAKRLPKSVTYQELAKQPLLMLERLSSTRRFWDRVFEQEGVSLKPQIELGSLDLLLEFARIGLGISAVTLPAARELTEAGQLVVLNLKHPPAPRSIGVITSKQLPPSPCAKAFLTEIKKSFH